MDHALTSSHARAAAWAAPRAASAATVRHAFEPVADLAAAEAYTRQLAHSHYENFSVVSIFLPRRLRQDFCNVYAFCRTADDLGDEVADRRAASELLRLFKTQTQACYEGEARSAIFTALSRTIARHEIPIEPFLDLIDAFEQDQHVDRYESFEQVLGYCRRSANPVGRLVLYMSGYRDVRRQALSDATCTALQLANFWQDVSRDLVERDRIYLPGDSMRRFGVDEAQLRVGRCDEGYRRLIAFECERAEALFHEGDALLPLLDGAVKAQVTLFARGGRAVLKAIRRQGYDTLTSRPRLSRLQKAALVAGAVPGALAGRLFGRAANP